MKRLSIALLIALLGVSACASVQPARSSRLEIAQGRGFTTRAEIVESGGGSVVRGSVCRSAFTPPPPRYVRLERLGADGLALDARMVPIRAMPGYRGGCGFFSFANALSSGERARLAALRWGG